VKVRTKNDREGRYAVAWKVVGDDGHTITGTVRFRVTR
jgi:methionine-rich copper-binding protein CopC